MIEFVNKMEAHDVNILELARAIKKQCRNSHCIRCDCFDTFAEECQIGEPAGWPIDEGRIK